jgi:hypothetical protein
LWFEASRFERLGRRIAASPRAVLVALAALTAAASPGVIRSELQAPVAGDSAGGAAPGDSLVPNETLLVELVCDAGLWSTECLASVAELTRALSDRSDLVEAVDSLSDRPRVVQEDGRLALRPLLDDVAGDEAALRRMRARADADRAALRGVAAANERAALLQASLVPGAPAREVHALVESLRARFDRPPAVEFAATSGTLRAHELELAARSDLERVTLAALAGLALLGALAARSAKVAVAGAALAAAALAWCSAALALGRVALGAAGAIVPCLVCASAVATSFALWHRVSSEQRAGRDLGVAVARALGAAGAPLTAAALAAVAALGSLAIFARPALRPLALASALAFASALALVGLGLPATLVAFRRGGAARGGARAAGPRGLWLDGVLARLDGALRAPRAGRVRRIAVSLALGAVAVLGTRQLEGDANLLRFSPAHTPTSDALERLSRDFGGTALLRVVVDSGAPGGAAEPLFLERVQDLERRAAEQPGVGSARSLVDAAVLPAMRASHDDDPGFAVVPPTRGQVDAAYDLFEREAPERLHRGTDTTRRHLAIDLIADTRDLRALAALRSELEARAAISFGRPDAVAVVGTEFAAAEEGARLVRAAPLAALSAVAVIGAVASLALESAVAGGLAALPAALAVLFVLGAMGSLELPLDSVTSALASLVAASAAGPALLYLSRVRELAAAGAELHVAVSIALRDVSRPIAEGALASVLFLTLLASALPPLRTFGALACGGVFVAGAGVLVALPIGVRTLRPKFLIERAASFQVETLSCVREVETRREE